MEELVAEHRSVFAGVCEFLGIDSSIEVGLAQANVADLKKRPPVLASRLRGLGGVLPRPIADLGRRLVGGLGKKVGKPDLDPAIRVALLKELRPDLERLGEFVGKDLAAIWNLGS